MGAFHKEKVSDSQKRARARRKQELINDGFLGVEPVKRGPSARVRGIAGRTVELGQRVAVKLDNNTASSLAGIPMGTLTKVPSAIRRCLATNEIVEATVSRKHSVGDGFDIEFDPPKAGK